MYERVNPSHVDKQADRIAGALVDLAYLQQDNPLIAVEVLLGHGRCYIIAETSVKLDTVDVYEAVYRIVGTDDVLVYYDEYPQDEHLAENQEGAIRCGDNGIFRGLPVTREQSALTDFAKRLYSEFPYDGKFILDLREKQLVICQSNVESDMLAHFPDLLTDDDMEVTVNPLGDWTGGMNVDTGAVNRKLGSDMGYSITGGGLHGKDLSKADVSVNIYAFLKAQLTGKPVELFCAIGDETVDGRPYSEIVEIARGYIKAIGGFEKFAEWGLIR